MVRTQGSPLEFDDVDKKVMAYADKREARQQREEERKQKKEAKEYLKVVEEKTRRLKAKNDMKKKIAAANYTDEQAKQEYEKFKKLAGSYYEIVMSRWRDFKIISVCLFAILFSFAFGPKKLYGLNLRWLLPIIALVCAIFTYVYLRRCKDLELRMNEADLVRSVLNEMYQIEEIPDEEDEEW